MLFSHHNEKDLHYYKCCISQSQRLMIQSESLIRKSARLSKDHIQIRFLVQFSQSEFLYLHVMKEKNKCAQPLSQTTCPHSQGSRTMKFRFYYFKYTSSLLLIWGLPGVHVCVFFSWITFSKSKNQNNNPNIKPHTLNLRSAAYVAFSYILSYF